MWFAQFWRNWQLRFLKLKLGLHFFVVLRNHINITETSWFKVVLNYWCSVIEQTFKNRVHFISLNVLIVLLHETIPWKCFQWNSTALSHLVCRGLFSDQPQLNGLVTGTERLNGLLKVGHLVVVLYNSPSHSIHFIKSLFICRVHFSLVLLPIFE